MELHSHHQTLLDLVRVHNTTAVRAALQRCSELETADRQMKTPLMLATENQDFEIAKSLVRAGANVNARDIFQNTPFLVAVSEGHATLVQAMLRSSPDFSLCNRFGGTALTSACERGQVEIVQILLSSNYVFDINHRDHFGWTPLLETVTFGDGSDKYIRIAELLIIAGADIFAVDLEGQNCLEHAKRRKLEKMVEFLTKAFEDQKKDPCS